MFSSTTTIHVHVIIRGGNSDIMVTDWGTVRSPDYSDWSARLQYLLRILATSHIAQVLVTVINIVVPRPIMVVINALLLQTLFNHAMFTTVYNYYWAQALRSNEKYYTGKADTSQVH